MHIWCAEYLICDPVNGSFDLQRGCDPQVEKSRSNGWNKKIRFINTIKLQAFQSYKSSFRPWYSHSIDEQKVRTCQAFPLTFPLYDALQRRFWGNSSHIWEFKISDRTQFSSPFLGTEQAIITTVLFWVLMGGPVSTPTLLSWIGYSDFWWAAGGTETERRYFNAWKVLEMSTLYNFYLESKLIGRHGCVLEAQ